MRAELFHDLMIFFPVRYRTYSSQSDTNRIKEYILDYILDDLNSWS